MHQSFEETREVKEPERRKCSWLGCVRHAEHAGKHATGDGWEFDDRRRFRRSVEIA